MIQRKSTRYPTLARKSFSLVGKQTTEATNEILWATWGRLKFIHLSRPDKNKLRSETRTERFRLILYTASEIGSFESTSETQIGQNQTKQNHAGLKFSTKLFIFTWQAYWTKNRLARSWLNRSLPDPNRINPKCNLIRNLTQHKLNSACTRIK